MIELVFAGRSRSIAHLSEILEQPLHRKCVDNLVCGHSNYGHGHATALEVYIQKI